MKLKMSEDGTTAVLKDGMPVYVHDDGKEVPFDAAGAMAKIKELNGESKSRREALEAAQQRLASFEGVDVTEARQALDTVRNLQAGELKTAAQVDEMRKSLTKQIEEGFQAKSNQLQDLLKQAQDSIAQRDASINRLLVKGAFDTSSFLKEKTVLLPEFAFNTFGQHFSVEVVDGELRAVAKKDGQPILSRANPGQYASAEEAIEELVLMHPQKDLLLRAPAAGGGGAGPSKPGAPQKKDFQTEYDALMKAGDVQGAIALKNRQFLSDK